MPVSIELSHYVHLFLFFSLLLRTFLHLHPKPLTYVSGYTSNVCRSISLLSRNWRGQAQLLGFILSNAASIWWSVSISIVWCISVVCIVFHIGKLDIIWTDLITFSSRLELPIGCSFLEHVYFEFLLAAQQFVSRIFHVLQLLNPLFLHLTQPLLILLHKVHFVPTASSLGRFCSWVVCVLTDGIIDCIICSLSCGWYMLWLVTRA